MELVLPNLPAFLAGLFLARSFTSATFLGVITKLVIITLIAVYWSKSSQPPPQGDVALSVIMSLLFGAAAAWLGYGVRRLLTHGVVSQSPSMDQIISNPLLLNDPRFQMATDRWSEAYEKELKVAQAAGLRGKALIAEAQYQMAVRADRQKIFDGIFGFLIWTGLIGGIIWLIIAYFY